MALLMQCFYWDCPREENLEARWWRHVCERVRDLADVGFDTLWLPPAHKAANIDGVSMGYDPYDYYDLGDVDQKGAIPTWFGTRQDLLDLIQTAHTHQLNVLADLVINHCNGADATEINPLTGQARWTLFRPGSGRFPRNWECFHPSNYERWDQGTFGGMPDLSHRSPYVYAEIMKLTRWLVEEIGFDGFRFDYVKGYGGQTVAAIQEYRYVRNGEAFRPFGVAEHWDSAAAIESWAAITNFTNDNPVHAFDFPLRELLKSVCDTYGFSLRNLTTWDTVLRNQPDIAVTFVENHDLRDPGRPIANDKLLAYSYILTHEGSPCVFWKDYFNAGLADAGNANGIAALVNAYRRYAGGTTQVLWVDDDLYIMQRSGYGNQPGLIYVLNNNGDRWKGAWVSTQWRNVALKPVAWWGHADRSQPETQLCASDGRGQFYAPPRGYAVYAPVS